MKIVKNLNANAQVTVDGKIVTLKTTSPEGKKPTHASATVTIAAPDAENGTPRRSFSVIKDLKTGLINYNATFAKSFEEITALVKPMEEALNAFIKELGL